LSSFSISTHFLIFEPQLPPELAIKANDLAV